MFIEFFTVRRLILLLSIFFFTSHNCRDVVEEKCTNACSFFIKCTEEIQKMKIDGEILKQGTIQCIDGCSRFQSQILTCFESESNSCNGMAECMKQTGLGE